MRWSLRGALGGSNGPLGCEDSEPVYNGAPVDGGGSGALGGSHGPSQGREHQRCKNGEPCYDGAFVGDGSRFYDDASLGDGSSGTLGASNGCLRCEDGEHIYDGALLGGGNGTLGRSHGPSPGREHQRWMVHMGPQVKMNPFMKVHPWVMVQVEPLVVQMDRWDVNMVTVHCWVVVEVEIWIAHMDLHMDMNTRYVKNGEPSYGDEQRFYDGAP